MTRSLYDLDGGELAALVAEAGEPPYRARQLAHWLDRRRQPDLRAMTNLPRSLRARLSERFAGLGDQRLELPGVQVVERPGHGERTRSKAAST